MMVQLGVATVVNVLDDMSIGKLVADFDPAKIQVKDLIGISTRAESR